MTAADVFVGLTKDEAEELYRFLERQYISHAEYERVHQLMNRIYDRFHKDQA